MFLFFPLLRALAHLVVEETQAVIYPVQPLSLEAETLTSNEGEKTSQREQKADKMETIESW